MIRVPRPTDYSRHIRRCAYLGNIGMARDRREKTVDVDGAEPLCQFNMCFRCERLIWDHNDAMGKKCIAQGDEPIIRESIQIDRCDYSAKLS